MKLKLLTPKELVIAYIVLLLDLICDWNCFVIRKNQWKKKKKSKKLS